MDWGAEKLGVEELGKIFEIEQLDNLFNFLAAAKQLEQYVIKSPHAEICVVSHWSVFFFPIKSISVPNRQDSSKTV